MRLFEGLSSAAHYLPGNRAQEITKQIDLKIKREKFGKNIPLQHQEQDHPQDLAHHQ